VLQIASVQLVRCRLVSRLVLPLLLSTTLASAQAAAPDCPEQDATVCGRRHFEVGNQAFENGDFASAAAEFQAAMAQRPHAVIRFNLALSLARLGRPSAAIEQLSLVQADESADKDLRERAAKERRSAELAQSRVTFRLSDPTRERIELDGVAVSLAPEGELALDPGTHHVRVISGNSVVLDQELELSPSERVELRVGERSRRIDVVVVPEATPKKPALVAVVPEHSSAKLSPVYFYVGAGATLALTGLTVWSGVATKRALSDYNRDLPGLTQAQADARVAHGHSLERRTNLLLAGSLICAAGTAALGIWLVDFSGRRQVSLGFSPSFVALSGRF
jgi:hypothetical protein